MVLYNNQALAPFFSEPMQFIRGLDPLGLQNTPEATFALLLPGLNNVTGRIRYYSFYCWLLDAYSKHVGSTDPAEQQSFIRRAELLFALVNCSSNRSSPAIAGSEYANRMLDNHQLLDLASGTYKPDGNTIGTYWQFKTGVFGQYYLGSLFDIGLVTEREQNSGIYARTHSAGGEFVSGSQLANIFRSSIASRAESVFLEAVKKGSVARATVRSLEEGFNAGFMGNSDDEVVLLRKLLMQKDYPLFIEEQPTSFRRQTIKHLLQFSHENGKCSDRDFVWHAYSSKGKAASLDDECLHGWYYYQFNECWQYACLAIFNGFMQILEDEAGSGWAGLFALTEKIVKEVCAILVRDEIAENEHQTIEDILHSGNEWAPCTDIFILAKESDRSERIANSFFFIWALINENKTELQALKAYGSKYGIEREGDGATFCMQFTRFYGHSLQDFLREFLLNHIIFRHQFIAYRKMAGRAQSTQLFLYEEGRIRKLQNFEPSLTGPRINRLLGFLQDLGIMAEGKLTPVGVLFLNEH